MRHILFFFIAGFLLFGAHSFAHESGASFEAEVGKYLVDIGYDESPAAGEAVRFDLGLYEADEEVAFEGAWVRIAEGNRLLFAGPIQGSESVRPGLSVTFDRAGIYQIFVRYEGEETLAEASFDLEVGPSGADASVFVVGSIFFAGGLLLGFSFSRWQKK